MIWLFVQCDGITYRIFSYPERRQPNKKIFKRLKLNLQNFGAFVKKRSKNYEIREHVNNSRLVLNCVQEKPRTSLREIEHEVGVSKSVVQRILRKNKYHPYKIKIVQHLNHGDAQRRVNFCNWYLQMVQENPAFPKNIIWSDECHVSSAGIFNRHNNRHWSNHNEHQIFERQAQGRFGFNISCFILGNRLTYRIFNGNLTAQRYIEILRTSLLELLDDIPLQNRPNIYYQQDGAPAHNSVIVRDYLDNNFPNHWIGTRGPVFWPARSPDLSILDFFYGAS